MGSEGVGCRPEMATIAYTPLARTSNGLHLSALWGCSRPRVNKLVCTSRHARKQTTAVYWEESDVDVEKGVETTRRRDVGCG
ncbi:unnamed protein product [Ectocarpus fasciculatus]